MEMKYYNPSNNFKAPIPREPKPYIPPVKKPEIVLPATKETAEENIRITPERKQFAPDDLLLLGLILFLVMNHCEDYLILFILAFLLLSDHSIKAL